MSAQKYLCSQTTYQKVQKLCLVKMVYSIFVITNVYLIKKTQQTSNLVSIYGLWTQIFLRHTFSPASIVFTKALRWPARFAKGSREIHVQLFLYIFLPNWIKKYITLLQYSCRVLNSLLKVKGKKQLTKNVNKTVICSRK